jgi:hydrophobic/amphiphilic exporter-1 (mainly G- bacteria), HAE1 family
VQKLAEVCIRRPVFAAMLILALVVAGAVSYVRLPTDRLPSVDLPTVSVRTVLPGAAPEQVESEVSRRIEEAVNTIEGLEELRSISGPGSSIVMATFGLERDVDTAAQDVRDRVATVLRDLPEDAEPPIVSKFDSDSSAILELALSGRRELRELTEIADKLVKVTLERCAGVGEVRLVGGVSRTINVWVDADRLAAHGLPVTAVRDAVAEQNADVPGGNLTGSAREQVVRTMGRLTDPAAFDEIVIAMRDGVPVRLKDVGRAEDGTREPRSSARFDGQPAVSLEIRRQSGSNSMEVIAGVKAALQTLRPQLPAGVELAVVRDQSRYIEAALHEINVHLVLGSLLASLVVLAFMRSWRSTLIAALAIPTSVIATFAAMEALGFTLNSVTMLALVLMVGIVIDDAIVVLENIFRFAEEKGLSAHEAAKQGTAEIGLAVLATTLSLVVIFVPVSFMSSISGRFLYQFGITAAVAVMVSLLVSFTLTPALAARLLRPAAPRPHGGGPPAPPGEPATPAAPATPASRRGFYARLDRAYERQLRFVLRHRAATALLALLVIASAVPLYGMLKQDYLPADVDEGEFQVNVTGPEGTSFAGMDGALARVEAQVLAHPEVDVVLASAGGSFLGQVNSARLHVGLRPHEERYPSFGRAVRAVLDGRWGDVFAAPVRQLDVMQDLRRALSVHDDLRISVRNYASFNIGGGNWDVDLALRGPDLDVLAEATEALRERVPEIGGLLDADTTLKLQTPELRVGIDRERAADLGISPRDVGTALRLLVGGDEEISRFRDPATNEEYDVQLRLREEDRAAQASLGRLLVPGRASPGPGQPAQDTLVELRNVATVDATVTAARVDRLDRQRSANLRATVAPGYALTDRLAALRTAVGALDLPPAYDTRVLGRGRELERAFVEFAWAFLLSIAFMYMILAAQFDSLVHPFTILLSLPLAVPFALLSMLLLGGTLNLYSALGILVLFGVVKKNSILQVDHMNQLRARGMPRLEAVLQGNRDRLRPILMTTLALVGGMLPLALGTGPGAEERRAVAMVVIGGQTLSLLLTLLVTPVAYTLFDDLVSRRRALARTAAPVAAPGGGEAAPAGRPAGPAE